MFNGLVSGGMMGAYEKLLAQTGTRPADKAGNTVSTAGMASGLGGEWGNYARKQKARSAGFDPSLQQTVAYPTIAPPEFLSTPLGQGGVGGGIAKPRPLPSWAGAMPVAYGTGGKMRPSARSVSVTKPRPYQGSQGSPTYNDQLAAPQMEKVDASKLTTEQLDKTLGNVMRNDWESIAPQLQQLFASQSSMLGETNTLSQARTDAAGLGSRVNNVTGRQLQRAGVTLSPMQQRAMMTRNSHSISGIGNAMVNSAVQQRYDQNNAARSNLLASVNAMKQGSQAGLVSVINNQSAREQATRDANASRKATNTGMVAGLVGNLGSTLVDKLFD